MQFNIADHTHCGSLATELPWLCNSAFDHFLQRPWDTLEELHITLQLRASQAEEASTGFNAM